MKFRCFRSCCPLCLANGLLGCGGEATGLEDSVPASHYRNRLIYPHAPRQ